MHMSLRIENITKKFADKVIIDGFSYTFSDKGAYCLFGESGTGKTTLLRMIAGLDTDYIGKIFGGGIKNVSVHFQEYRLFPQLNAIENATIMCNNSKECVDLAKNYLLRLGFCEEEMHLFPKELSGGMKQRVAFVRSLMKKCNILLLDEPTKELDSKLCSEINKIIKEESLSRLVITVSHRLDDIIDQNAIVVNM